MDPKSKNLLSRVKQDLYRIKVRKPSKEWQETINFDWDTNNLVENKMAKEQDEIGIKNMLIRLDDLVKVCYMCSLGRKKCVEYDPHVFSNLVFSRWMVVGQNPGSNECIQHQPFVGDAGKFFDDNIIRNGLKRSDFYITNMVKCYTVENRKPNRDEMSRCESLLKIEVTLLRPFLVICLGAVSFEAFVPGKVLSDSLGNIHHSDKFGVDVYPLYHPSPRNMSDKSRRDRFIYDLDNVCELIKTRSS